MKNKRLLTNLSSETSLGLTLRVAIFGIVMTAALLVVLMINRYFLHGSNLQIVVAMLLVVLVPMAAGIVLSEVPRGSDWLFARLGVATFCRTGLPLLIVILVDALTEGGIGEKAFGFLAFFYLIGFPASVWISVNRFKVLEPVNEVDRAAV